MEVTLVLAVATAVALLCEGIQYLMSLWGSKQKMPEHIKATMSETDIGMIEKTKDIIRTNFGDSVVDTVANLSNIERIALMTEFAQQLAKEYGLDDVNIDINVAQANNCGFYSWDDKKAVFNIYLLTIDKNHENFEYFVLSTIDTIIHELRHAVQHKAIQKEGFWSIDEERKILWAENRLNYIQASVDMRRYSGQPLENDASTFAEMAMEGVR